MKRASKIFATLGFALFHVCAAHTFAACGATTYAWTGLTSTAWSLNGNWSPAGQPNAAGENAYIQAANNIPLWPASSFTMTCFEIASGSFTATPAAARVLTIVGDYFRNYNPGSLTTNTNFTIRMNAAFDQTFANLDTINNLRISTTTALYLTEAFTVSTLLTIDTTAGVIQIQKGLTVSTAVTIPVNATVEVMSGATFVAAGGLTVNGVLKVNPGGKVLMGNGTTLSVPAGGVLQLYGSPGNVASLDASAGGSTYTLNVAGSLFASYFSISRTGTSGLNLTGTAQSLSNGDFHYIAAGGHAITLGAASVVTGLLLDFVGFHDDFGNTTSKNINATAYAGAVITVDNWLGLGSAKETDPSNKITWGSASPVKLEVSDRTASGSPAATVAKGAAASLFATFGFSLSDVATSTDITSITLSVNGDNVASDVNYLQVFADTNSNCAYDAGTDLQIGANLSVVGTPSQATVTIPAATLSVADTTVKCIHVLLAVNANAQAGDTLRVAINGTNDVTNSLAYSFSDTSGPPVQHTTSTITGTAFKKWGGSTGTAGASRAWAAAANDWNSSGTPASTDDCQIGPGYSFPTTNGARTCTNLFLAGSGKLDWNSTTDILTVLGALTIGPSYNFSLATSGRITFASTTSSQSIYAETTYPGNVTINNTSTSGLVSVNSNFTMNGALTLTAGTLRVASGYTLTVLGGVTVNGGTLQIDPGATLNLGDGTTLTVGASGALTLVGDASRNANFTCNGTTTGCAVVITGTISAQYYSFSRLAVAGVTVNSGATINASNFLQNGSFTYPIGTNPVMLTLNRQIPGNALPTMTFDQAGSSATGAKSIVTSTSAGTLTVSNYSGDLTNCCTTAPTYLVAWTSPTNTLKLTLNAAGSGTVNLGDANKTMARFGFQQTQAGAFANTNLTSIKITLDGTASAADVSGVRLYYDSACSGTGGTQIGTVQTFSGVPATTTFSSLSGAVVEFHATTPPLRCVYVQYDIASTATIGATLGAKISFNADVVNSQGYAFNGSYAPSVTGGLSTINGTTIIWDGSSSTAWATAANWNLARIPTLNDVCIIPNVARDPIISAAGAVCKSLIINNGILTINTTRDLSLYGSLTNTGTLTQTGTATITIRDNGTTATNQTIRSTSAVKLTFNKTAGGYVYIGDQNLTLNTFTIPAAQTFTFVVRDGDYLILPNGATISSGVFLVDQGGTVATTAGQTFLVSGGTLQTTGVNDGHPQDTTNKATFTVNGAGTWSFNSTSGTIDLTGFLFDYLDTNGLRVGGTTSLTHLDGGQLTNLSTTYTSVTGFQFNTTGTLPATADYVGWNWGPNNAPPATNVAYKLASSTGCASQTMSFTNWFGDFFVQLDFPNAQSKVTTVSCTLNIAASASPISLTELKATGYDSTVLIDWTTGLEFLHRGFNIYRSTAPDAGYVQINSKLIRNPLAADSVHGKYQFYDRSVANGTTYYYKLEDIAANGKRTLKGPLSATPLLFLGAAPSPDVSSVVSQDNLPVDVLPAPDTDSTPVTLAPGVVQLARTNHSLRLQIDVPAFTTAPSDLAPFVTLTIPGYSGSAEPFKPELPERVVLLEIPGADAATFALVSEITAPHTGLKIAPAREWTSVGGALTAGALTPDAVFYGTDQSLPSSSLALGEVVQSRGLSYLPLTIKPVHYNPVQETVTATSRMVVDIFLSGTPSWNVGGAVGESGPWGFEGGLKVHIKKAGLYQITFDELAASGLSGPFAGVNTANLRLFSTYGELPLQVTSHSGSFDSGDSIRFYAPFVENSYSTRNTLVLYADTVSGARMDVLSGADTGSPNLQPSFDRRVVLRSPSFGYFGEPLGEDREHIYWGRLVAPAPTAGDDRISATLALSNLASTGNVRIKAYVKGSRGQKIQNPLHHVRLYVNSSSNPDGDTTFQTNDTTLLIFTVPAQRFVEGNNVLELRAVGDLVPPADYDRVNLEKIEVDYPQQWIATPGATDILNYQANATLTLGGLATGSVSVYDVSNLNATAVLNGALVNADGQGGFQVSFGSVSTSGSGRKFHVVENANVLSPYLLELSAGSNLRATNQGADVIYLGPKALLPAMKPLADLRGGAGFRTKTVALEDVYQEFGNGIQSPQAIKSFLQFAYASWQAPALRYLVIVGDANYDPKNQLGGGTFPTVPVYVTPGQFVDYGNDNWYASLAEDSIVPTLAVGRIPGNTHAQIAAYVDKVLTYEAGETRPSAEQASQLFIASDQDQLGGEHFKQRADDLGTSIASYNNSLTVNRLSLLAGGDAAFKTQLLSAFNSGATAIHFMGHGSEKVWSATTVFQETDAAALTNVKLPFVIAMNCLNGYYYDSDRSFVSMTDALLFNPRGGAIAVWASTSLTSPDLQAPFQQALYETVAKNPAIRLGDAVRQAKIAGGISNGTAEIVGSWTLFGDPMLEVKIPSTTARAFRSVAEDHPDFPSGTSSGGSCAAVHSSGPSQPNYLASLLNLLLLALAVWRGRKLTTK